MAAVIKIKISIWENFSWIRERVGWGEEGAGVGWGAGGTGGRSPSSCRPGGEDLPVPGAGGVGAHVPTEHAGQGSRRPTCSPQSQVMLYIIWETQKQWRKLWKGLLR